MTLTESVHLLDNSEIVSKGLAKCSQHFSPASRFLLLQKHRSGSLRLVAHAKQFACFNITLFFYEDCDLDSFCCYNVQG